MNVLESGLKNRHISNLMKICPLEAELFDVGGRTDGQTDGHKRA
jgi:hypothetical protein